MENEQLQASSENDSGDAFFDGYQTLIWEHFSKWDIKKDCRFTNFHSQNRQP